MNYWTQCLEFYRQFRNQYFTTGSIWPSSRGLARAGTCCPAAQMRVRRLGGSDGPVRGLPPEETRGRSRPG